MELDERAEKQLKEDLNNLLFDLGDWARSEDKLEKLEDPTLMERFAYKIYNGMLGKYVSDRVATPEQIESHKAAFDYVSSNSKELSSENPLEWGVWAIVVNENAPEVKRRLYFNVKPEKIDIVTEHLLDYLNDGEENRSDFAEFKFLHPEAIEKRPFLLNRADNLVVYIGKNHDFTKSLVKEITTLNELYDGELLGKERPLFAREVADGIGYASEPSTLSERRANKIIQSWGKKPKDGFSFGQLVTTAVAHAYDLEGESFFGNWRGSNPTIYPFSREFDRRIDECREAVVDKAYDLLVNDFEHDFNMTQLFLRK